MTEGLPQITGAAAADIAELWARIALLEGDYLAARQALAACDPAIATELAGELNTVQAFHAQARELYNQGLAAARRGAYPAAAAHLARAVTLDPGDPMLWYLKLKVDLKCGHFQRCYAGLAELDRLNARPPEFHGLEQLLPPVAAG